MNRVAKLVSQLRPTAEEKELLSPKGCVITDLGIEPHLLENNSGNKSGFLYTLDSHAPGVFNKEQREFYEENGFILIKGLLSSVIPLFLSLLTRLKPPPLFLRTDENRPERSFLFLQSFR